MSTQQPPGGTPEGGYAQPQDPWGGYEPGIASVPTDPIPQQYDPYSAPPGEVWSADTIQHGGQYPYVPQQPAPKRTAKVIGIAALVLAVAGGAGYAAYLYFGPGDPTTSPSANASQTTPGPVGTSGSTAVPPEFDPHTVRVGDCIANRGSDDDPSLAVVPCTTKGSYKVLKVLTGESIVEGPGDKFDRDTTSVAACTDTAYKSWYGYQDATDDTLDVFFCMSAKSS